MYNFPSISLLVTHYNRSKSLEHLLSTFKNLKCDFGEIVVSDDGSKPEHLEYIKSLQNEYDFSLITTPKNKGLGNNINKGQDAVTRPYTLYIQEDFEPQSNFPTELKNALKYMDEDPSLDIVRFYAYGAYPYLKPFKDNFSEMYLPRMATNYTKIYFYSDHPHLRRSSFFSKFGRYPEGIKGDKTEYKMCISVLQNKAKGLFYNNFSDLLIQKNSSEEPSTMTRQNWKQSNNFLISTIRSIYRQLKYNYDIHFMRPLNKT